MRLMYIGPHMELGEIIIRPCTELTGLAHHDCPACGGEGVKVKKVLEAEPDEGVLHDNQVDSNQGPTPRQG